MPRNLGERIILIFEKGNALQRSVYNLFARQGCMLLTQFLLISFMLIVRYGLCHVITLTFQKVTLPLNEWFCKDLFFHKS